jgi:hypothetical protein
MERDNKLEIMAKMTEWDMWKAGGAVNDLALLCHDYSVLQGFYEDFDLSKPLEGYMFPVKLSLIMTELAEAIEAHRKGDMENLMEEMADIFIRLLDLAGAINMDVESEIQKKMAVNLKRPPKHGKAY